MRKDMINSNEKFTYFDELRIFQRIYNADLCTKNDASNTSFVPRNVFYRISTPFLMDSQTTNWLNEKLGIEKKRNRKRKHKEIAEYIGEDVQFVKNVYTEFQSTKNNMNESTMAQFEDIGNKLARECVKNAPNFHPITSMGDGIEIMDIDEDKNIFSTKCEHPILWRNRKAEFIQSNSFLFPPNSAFLHSDISLAKNLPKYGFVDFDFIILDPSWPNRTVKRQKSYETIKIQKGGEQFEKISKIPIENLLKFDGILCIWMTNSETSRKKADELIKHWGLKKLAKWNWLKICKTGEPICSFQSSHKMPFESFLLACKPESIGKDSKIPKEHCLISVPNANPSRKPPISKLLEEMCLIEPVKNGLELFGRYLLPNFITIGFEAAKFQNEYYFESIK